MKPRAQAVAELERNGYVFRRNGANHDIYYNPELGYIIPLKRHDFDEEAVAPYHHGGPQAFKRGRSPLYLR